MILKKLREISATAQTLQEVISYLIKDLPLNLRDIQSGFKNLSFSDNFNGWIETIPVIAASEEIQIKNRLSTVPSYKIVLRANSVSIGDGLSTWSSDFVYIKNYSSTTAASNVVVLFLA